MKSQRTWLRPFYTKCKLHNLPLLYTHRRVRAWSCWNAYLCRIADPLKIVSHGQGVTHLDNSTFLASSSEYTHITYLATDREFNNPLIFFSVRTVHFYMFSKHFLSWYYELYKLTDLYMVYDRGNYVYLYAFVSSTIECTNTPLSLSSNHLPADW